MEYMEKKSTAPYHSAVDMRPNARYNGMVGDRVAGKGVCMMDVTVATLTCLVMIASILFFPRVKVGKRQFDTYWMVTLAGALVLLCCGRGRFAAVGQALVADTAVNPLKILVLFMCMTVLSVFLDELGFFRLLAALALRRAGQSQTALFFLLYVTVSVLTVFTSNDIIILSFTPFICYFARNAGIDPIPYLAAEFVSANTWSLALVIGNPTNIYLATAQGVDFLSYIRVMLLPTLGAGAVSLLCLWLTFRRRLKAPLHPTSDAPLPSPDKPQLILGLAHLGVCTLALAVSSYVGVEMWLVSAAAVVSLTVCAAVMAALRRRPARELKAAFARAPFQLVPFLLSMFAIIVVLEQEGVVAYLTAFLQSGNSLFLSGVASFLSANLINNIPMCVLFGAALPAGDAGALYATVIGSNLGALLTPVGALAGIMWSGILSRHGHRFGYRDFLRLGATVGLPALAAALVLLWAVL